MTSDAGFILKKSLVPERYSDVRLDGLSKGTRKYRKDAKQWVADFPKQGGVYIWSNSRGVGKTHLAVCMLKGLVAEGVVKRQVSFFNFVELVEVAGDWGERYAGHDYYTWRERFRVSELVLLDDIAPVGKFSAAQATLAYRLVNMLYEKKSIVIVTANVSRDKLAGLFGDAGWGIISRLSGMCPLVWDVTDVGGPADDLRLRR